jgi:hypothetical protein
MSTLYEYACSCFACRSTSALEKYLRKSSMRRWWRGRGYCTCQGDCLKTRTLLPYVACSAQDNKHSCVTASTDKYGALV